MRLLGQPMDETGSGQNKKNPKVLDKDDSLKTSLSKQMTGTVKQLSRQKNVGMNQSSWQGLSN